MPSDDLLDHAKSDVDFYALLGDNLHPGSTTQEISRAYRRSALKHHPDHNRDDASAVDKFHALQIAYDVLSDVAAKAAYDNARAAREARKRASEMFEGKRRAMKEDLERREGGTLKRKREEADAEEMLEREIKRLAEDGRRRRLEREAALRKEARDSKADEKVEEEKVVTPVGGTNVPELSRTVRIQWPREGPGLEMNKDKLAAMFGQFGTIDSTVILKDKKRRLGSEKKKRLMATGIIVYRSIVGAHAAVEDTKKQTGPDWSIFSGVDWFEGKEPSFASSTASSTSPPSDGPLTPEDFPSTPRTSSKPRPIFPGLDSITSTPASTSKPGQSQTQGNGAGLRKVPSFASFSSANFNSPFSSPFGKTPNSPSLEEITLIRLKNAEKKKLEERIRREEAAAIAGGVEAS